MHNPLIGFFTRRIVTMERRDVKFTLSALLFFSLRLGRWLLVLDNFQHRLVQHWEYDMCVRAHINVGYSLWRHGIRCLDIKARTMLVVIASHTINCRHIEFLIIG